MIDRQREREREGGQRYAGNSIPRPARSLNCIIRKDKKKVVCDTEHVLVAAPT